MLVGVCVAVLKREREREREGERFMHVFASETLSGRGQTPSSVTRNACGVQTHWFQLWPKCSHHCSNL